MKRSAAIPRPGTDGPGADKNGRPRRPAAITLGALLYNWPAHKRRDFYFRIADEAEFDAVCLGEVVCYKRGRLHDPHLDEVAERLARGGKEVIFSTLAMVASARDAAYVAQAAARPGLVEANDLAAAELLRGRPFHVGPYVNVYSEDTARLLAELGATRICLPVELPAAAIGAIAKVAPAEIEVVAFGRIPLAMSARCFHARSRGRRKDTCRYACGEDADGGTVETLEGERFLAIAGCHILSHAYANLAGEVVGLRALGVQRFRLLPQAIDMIAAAGLFRRLLDDKVDGTEARAQLRRLVPKGVGVANGFVHGQPGEAFVERPLPLAIGSL